ncbi:MAG: hypothetical protein AAFV95_14200 [Bacteroidota bacterium]
MQRTTFLSILCLVFLWACETGQPQTEAPSPIIGNPAAEGFRAESSDAKAIALADSVMARMGGRNAWENARFIEWNFFGRRKLYWDKLMGRVRIESEPDDYTLLVNIHSEEGQVRKGGEVLTEPDSLAKYLKMGKEIWINDSYWLVMPYKLKDSGVALKYARTDTTQNGRSADVLDLTFEAVGVTPENRYEVFIDKEGGLVSQWSFYTNAADTVARFTTPWEGYDEYEGILLASGRGGYQLSDVLVRPSMPDAAFESLDWESDK